MCHVLRQQNNMIALLNVYSVSTHVWMLHIIYTTILLLFAGALLMWSTYRSIDRSIDRDRDRDRDWDRESRERGSQRARERESSELVLYTSWNILNTLRGNNSTNKNTQCYIATNVIFLATSTVSWNSTRMSVLVVNTRADCGSMCSN